MKEYIEALKFYVSQNPPAYTRDVNSILELPWNCITTTVNARLKIRRQLKRTLMICTDRCTVCPSGRWIGS